MAIYGYCRVNTIDQADKGNSLDVQRSRIEGETKSKGLSTIDKFFVDKHRSNTKTNWKKHTAVTNTLRDLKKRKWLVSEKTGYGLACKYKVMIPAE